MTGRSGGDTHVASVDRACDQAATPTLPAPTEHTIRRTTLQPTVRDPHAILSVSAGQRHSRGNDTAERAVGVPAATSS